jgi:hypothetical protein
LEGGYNLESISLAAEGVVRVLSGENLPIINSQNQLNMIEVI